MLTADRKTCKIVDFGVSAVFEKPVRRSAAWPSLSMQGDDTGGAAVASPAFASPEQIVAARASEETPGVHGTASDIWAMGVTLYCMLTGHLPWQHIEVLEMYRAIEHDQCVSRLSGWLTTQTADPTLDGARRGQPDPSHARQGSGQAHQNAADQGPLATRRSCSR